MIRRYRTILAAAAAALIIALAFAGPASAVTEHCPDGGTKFEATFDGQYDGTILPAGTQFCVKGSTDATGILTADGQTSLFDYLDNDHNVSYYVTYQPEVTPSPSPSATPSPTPSPTPSASASPTPSPEPTPVPTPSLEPSPTPSPSSTPSDTPSATPSVSPTSSPIITPEPVEPAPTLPPTDMSETISVSDDNARAIAGILGALSILLLIDRYLDRKRQRQPR